MSSDYVFAEADLNMTLEEMKPILAANHRETGVYDLPFNPDYVRYLALANGADSKLFTARLQGKQKAHPGELAAFAIFFMDTEIQQKDVRSATQSVNYVAKEHRGIGLAFMKFCDDILKSQGVNSVWRQASLKFDVSKIYERMGYTLIEKSYLKRL